jgi:hypothetical protein
VRQHTRSKELELHDGGRVPYGGLLAEVVMDVLDRGVRILHHVVQVGGREYRRRG